jgi:hypothetical protein
MTELIWLIICRTEISSWRSQTELTPAHANYETLLLS